MSEADEFQMASDFAERLAADGLADPSAKLLDDLRAGSSGTEISMMLRYVLEFLAFPGTASDRTIALGRELFQHLDKKLQ